MKKNKIHILIVDDDDRIRFLLRDYLSENDYIVSTAIDGIDAKKKIKVSEQEVKLTQSKTKVSDKKEASIKVTNKKSKEEKK